MHTAELAKTLKQEFLDSLRKHFEYFTFVLFSSLLPSYDINYVL